MKKSVSIIVTAFNEEDNISDAIKSILKAFHGIITDYEILIVNDGSTDNTQTVIEREIKKNRHIHLINNPVNQGVGTSFQTALKQARKTYVTVFPGDNDMSSKSLKELCQKMNSADLVITYPASQHRSSARKILSLTFTKFLNILFRQKIKYYNGPFIAKLTLFKNLPLKSTGFLIFAEFKLKLISQGYSYVEIPFVHVGRKHGNSKAVSISNLIDVAKTTLFLVIDKATNQF